MLCNLCPHAGSLLKHTQSVSNTKNAKNKDRTGEEHEKPPNIFKRCYRAYFADSGESYVDALLSANAVVRAGRFFPALFITVWDVGYT
jgi:hypothetical protein